MGDVTLRLGLVVYDSEAPEEGPVISLRCTLGDVTLRLGLGSGFRTFRVKQHPP